MAKINKFDTPEFRSTLIMMATKIITSSNNNPTGGGGSYFTSYRTPDNKHFFLVPTGIPESVRRITFGFTLKSYEIDYVLLGQLNMVK